MAKKKKSATKKTRTKKSTKSKAIKKKTTTKRGKKKTTSSKKSSKKTAVVKSTPTKTSSKQKGIKKKNYSEIDRLIMEIVIIKNSVYVDEVQTSLDLSGSEIKKAIIRLENKKKIIKKIVMNESKWVSEITKIDDYGLSVKTKKKPQKLIWDTMGDCPCFLCPVIYKCTDGQNYMNPKNCEPLSQWLKCQLDNTVFVSPFHPNFEVKKKKSAKNKAAEEKKEVKPLK